MYVAARQTSFVFLRYTFFLSILKDIVVWYGTSSKFGGKYNWSQILTRVLAMRKHDLKQQCLVKIESKKVYLTKAELVCLAHV